MFPNTQIPAQEFTEDPNIKQNVYLQAQFPNRLLEKVVLVSFQSGYIYIQTDKTLYTPGNKGESSATLQGKHKPALTNISVLIVCLDGFEVQSSA